MTITLPDERLARALGREIVIRSPTYVEIARETAPPGLESTGAKYSFRVQVRER